MIDRGVMYNKNIHGALYILELNSKTINNNYIKKEYSDIYKDVGNY